MACGEQGGWGMVFFSRCCCDAALQVRGQGGKGGPNDHPPKCGEELDVGGKVGPGRGALTAVTGVQCVVCVPELGSGGQV